MEISRIKLPKFTRRRRAKTLWRAKCLSQWRLKWLQWAHNSKALSRSRQYITPRSRTNTHTHNIAHNIIRLAQGMTSPICQLLTLMFLFHGADATDLSDSETAELNDIDSYFSTVTQMGACKSSDIWRIIDADDDPNDTYFCGSRPNNQVRFISDPDFHEVRPYSEIGDIHPHNILATTHG